MHQTIRAEATPPMARNARTAGRQPVLAQGEIDQHQLERMIAERPSRDNPFVTRINRKRRALFLLRTRMPMQSAA